MKFEPLVLGRLQKSGVVDIITEGKVKYEYDMTTERDRRNQLKKGLEEGLKKGLSDPDIAAIVPLYMEEIRSLRS